MGKRSNYSKYGPFGTDGSELADLRFKPLNHNVSKSVTLSLLAYNRLFEDFARLFGKHSKSWRNQ